MKINSVPMSKRTRNTFKIPGHKYFFIKNQKHWLGEVTSANSKTKSKHVIRNILFKKGTQTHLCEVKSIQNLKVELHSGKNPMNHQLGYINLYRLDTRLVTYPTTNACHLIIEAIVA